jgi:hypothetical protein
MLILCIHPQLTVQKRTYYYILCTSHTNVEDATQNPRKNKENNFPFYRNIYLHIET